MSSEDKWMLARAYEIACYRLAQGSNLDGTPENHAYWKKLGKELEASILEESRFELSAPPTFPRSSQKETEITNHLKEEV